jgi:6-phosphogluconolactonase
VSTGAPPRTTVVFDSPELLARGAAEQVATIANDAGAQRGRFAVSLAGGETPRPLYQQLARDYRESIAWDSADICFGDERCIPPHNPASNFRLAWTTLLEHVPIVETRVHRILGELGPQPAASQYDTRLRQLFADDPDTPTFDLAIMGVGVDGHTASLFPNDVVIDERRRWAAPVHAPPRAKVPERVTLTLPVLNRARVVLFLCTGAEKRDVAARILGGDRPDLPAARVRGVERTIWLLDSAAAP